MIENEDTVDLSDGPVGEDRPMEGANVVVRESTQVPLDLIDLWEGNPNVMDPQSVQDLADDIIADGFDEPVGLIPVDETAYEEGGHEKYVSDGGRFQCWNGNHRVGVMRELGADSIPSVVRLGLSDEDKAIKVVRRNLVRGDIDPVRFSEMVDNHLFGIDPEVLSRSMGFLDTSEFKDLIEAAGLDTTDVVDVDDDESEGGGESQSRRENRGGEPIDGLASMISNIMSKYGDSAPQSYLCFVWKDKVNFLGMMDDKTKRSVEKLAEQLEDSGQNFNDALTQMIEERLEDSQS